MGLFKRKQDKRAEEITAWAKAYLEEKAQGRAVPAVEAEALMGEASEPLEKVEVAAESAAAASMPVRADERLSAQQRMPALPPEEATVVPTDEPPAETTAAEEGAKAVVEPGVTAKLGLEPTPAVGEEAQAERTAPTLFERLRSGLSKTRDGFIGRMDRLFSSREKIDGAVLEELEQILIESDIGVQHSMALIGKLEEAIKTRDLDRPALIKGYIRNEILGVLSADGHQLKRPASDPFVIMVVGVNGVGKTTTIGKLARRFTQAGEAVLLAAGDTFRAAAAEQLEIWGGRVGADVIRHQSGSDPSAVIFDALKAAESRKAGVVIADTAGRLHTKVNLMEELKKMKRVMDKVIPGTPHEVLLVLDATTGQNALSQARIFNEAVGVTGIVLTKLDGTAKGGIVTAIVGELGLPVKLIGIGEGMEDLRDFDPEEFVRALFEAS